MQPVNKIKFAGRVRILYLNWFKKRQHFIKEYAELKSVLVESNSLKGNPDHKNEFIHHIIFFKSFSLITIRRLMMSYFGAKLSAPNSIKLHLYFQFAPEMPLISQTDHIYPTRQFFWSTVFHTFKFSLSAFWVRVC